MNESKDSTLKDEEITKMRKLLFVSTNKKSICKLGTSWY